MTVVQQMKFYNRVSELEELANLHDQSASSGRMTVITGRRRVGKTILALESAKSARHLYLFVSRQAETLALMAWLRAGAPS